MYKQRFAKWKWQKYNNSKVNMRKGASYRATPASRKRLHAQAGAGSSSTKNNNNSSSSSNNSSDGGDAKNNNRALVSMSVLPFDNEDTYHLTAALSTWRAYLHGWSMDPRWKTPTKFDCLPGAQSQLAYVAQDFRGALQHFASRDLTVGGRLLRLGFLRLEEVLLADHIECLWVACVLIPHMLLTAGYTDILLLFVRHVAGIAALRMRDHPLCDATRRLRLLAERDPRQLSFYVESTGSVWVDTVASLRGRDDAVTLDLRRAFFNTVPPRPEAIDAYLGDMESLARQAAAVYGDPHYFPISKEVEALHVRWRYRRVTPDMVPRVEAILAKLDAIDIPPEWSAYHVGASFVRCYLLLAVVPAYLGDFDRAEPWRRKFLTSQHLNDKIWLTSALDLESFLRSVGKVDEAMEVQTCRLEGQVPPPMAKVLDEEENQLVVEIKDEPGDGEESD